MHTGRYNIALGLITMAGYMLLGFVLIYARDLAPGKAEWIAGSLDGKHFEATLAHVHGALFAVLNVALGLVLARTIAPPGQRRAIAWLGLIGMLMPVGILAEVIFGVPPVLVIVGAASMTLCVAWLGIVWLRSTLVEE